MHLNFKRLAVLFLMLGASCTAFGLPAFKVRLNGNTSYLVGTMHRQFLPTVLPPKLFTLLSKSEVAYFEANLENYDQSERASLLREVRQGQSSGRNLKKLFSSPDWLKLRRILPYANILPDDFVFLSSSTAYEKANIAFEMADRELIGDRSVEIVQNEPELLEKTKAKAALTSSILGKGDDMDQQLISKAKSEDKLIHYLDSSEENLVDVSPTNLVTFVRFRLKRQAQIKNTSRNDFIDYMNKKTEESPEELAYLQWIPGQDLRFVSHEPWLHSDATPQFRSLHERHSEWWKRLLPAFVKGNAFVAVGASHVLTGEDSLIDLLEKAGATVEFIDLTDCERSLE